MQLTCFVYPGWNPRIRPAEARRDWMTDAAESFPYRCLPLNIANSHGWELLNPCGFSARWTGGPAPEDVEIRVDAGGDPAEHAVSLFGLGTVTFHIPGLIRTEPGWNLFVGGPPNSFRDGLAPLSGIIETDWSPYSFTMNWRFTRPDLWVRFEAGEAFCHIFPVPRGAVERAVPEIVPIETAPDLKAQFEAWSAGRDAFQARMRETPPDRPADKWQKLYYRGVDAFGRPGVADHQSKLAAPPFVETPQPQGDRPPPVSRAAVPSCPAGQRPAPTGAALTLAKRDWLLSTLARQRALSEEASSLFSYEKLDPKEFLDHHYAVNRPVLLKGMIADWSALSRWSADYFRQTIGRREVEYQGGREADARFERDKDRHRRTAPFDDYLTMIGSGGNDAYITAFNSARNAEAFAPLMDDVGSIDGYLESGDPGAKGMLWIGPAGTFTPLHHDLTNNLLIQVVGRKRVVMASPLQTPRLLNDQHVFSRVGDFENPRLAEDFPGAAEIPTFVVEIGPGDALFLPIGWWHQVRSLDFSASVTNTNFVWPNDAYAQYPRE